MRGWHGTHHGNTHKRREPTNHEPIRGDVSEIRSMREKFENVPPFTCSEQPVCTSCVLVIRTALHVFWLSVPHFMCFGYPYRVSRVLVIRTAFRVFETACRRGLVKSYHSCVCGSYPNFRVFWSRVPRFMCLVPSTFKHVSFGTSLKFPFFVLQTHEFRDIAYFPFFGILTLACYRILFRICFVTF